MLKKKCLMFFMAALLLASTGCGKKEEAVEAVQEEETVVEVARNDWMGGFWRLAAIQSDVQSKITILDSHNYEIIQGNPDNYWSDENFRYLHFVPLDSWLLPYTVYFNEEENFSVIQQNIINAFENTNYNVDSILKVDANHYSLNISYRALSWISYEEKFKQKSIQCIYDASHDWLQMSTSVSENYNSYTIEEELYEFAQLSANEYALQNENERLYVKYEDGALKEFYYSVLPDVTKERTDLYYAGKLVMGNTEYVDDAEAMEATEDEDNVETADNESDTETAEPVNKKNIASEKIGLRYTKNDNSMFSHLEDCSPEWVMAAGELKSRITYADGVLSVSVQNKLTGDTESFSVKEAVEVPAENMEESIEEET